MRLDPVELTAGIPVPVYKEQVLQKIEVFDLGPKGYMKHKSRDGYLHNVTT